MENESIFMQKAYELAERARGKTSPNPFVGAVIIRNNRVVGEGYTQTVGQDHAEIQALKQAGMNAKGSDLYVTLEPCCHYGRTPPCTEAIIKAGIKRVFIGIKDPNPLVNGRGIKILKNAGIEIKTGIMQLRILEQNKIFIKYIRSGLPWVTIKTACSLDGKISGQKGQQTKITGPEADIFTQQLRAEYNAIMVGTNTILIDNSHLTCRNGGGNPVRIILDRELKIPQNYQVFKPNARRILVTNQKTLKYTKLVDDLLVIPTLKNGYFSLKSLFRKLAKLEISSVLVEGGGVLNGDLLNTGLVDELDLIYVPKIFGQNDLPVIFSGLKTPLSLKSGIVSQLGGDYVHHFYLNH